MEHLREVCLLGRDVMREVDQSGSRHPCLSLEGMSPLGLAHLLSAPLQSGLRFFPHP